MPMIVALVGTLRKCSNFSWRGGRRERERERERERGRRRLQPAVEGAFREHFLCYVLNRPERRVRKYVFFKNNRFLDSTEVIRVPPCGITSYDASRAALFQSDLVARFRVASTQRRKRTRRFNLVSKETLRHLRHKSLDVALTSIASSSMSRYSRRHVIFMLEHSQIMARIGAITY